MDYIKLFCFARHRSCSNNIRNVCIKQCNYHFYNADNNYCPFKVNDHVFLEVYIIYIHVIPTGQPSIVRWYTDNDCNATGKKIKFRPGHEVHVRSGGINNNGIMAPFHESILDSLEICVCIYIRFVRSNIFTWRSIICIEGGGTFSHNSCQQSLSETSERLFERVYACFIMYYISAGNQHFSGKVVFPINDSVIN